MDAELIEELVRESSRAIREPRLWSLEWLDRDDLFAPRLVDLLALSEMLLPEPDQHRDIAFLRLLVLPTAQAHPHLVIACVDFLAASATNRRLGDSADRRDLGMSASDSRERLHET
jgi:hypothetical protein